VSLVYNCCWRLPAQSFSGPSPVGLATTFYCPRFESSLFVASYKSQGYGLGIRLRFHTGVISESQSQSYVTNDGQSASLSWNKAPIWGLRPDLYFCMTVAGFTSCLVWLYDLGTDLIENGIVRIEYAALLLVLPVVA
jgi:hypothetical protein